MGDSVPCSEEQVVSIASYLESGRRGKADTSRNAMSRRSGVLALSFCAVALLSACSTARVPAGIPGLDRLIGGPSIVHDRRQTPMGEMVVGTWPNGENRISAQLAKGDLFLADDMVSIRYLRDYGDRTQGIYVYHIARANCPVRYQIVAVKRERIDTAEIGDCYNEASFSRSGNYLYASVPSGYHWAYDRRGDIHGPLDNAQFAAFTGVPQQRRSAPRVQQPQQRQTPSPTSPQGSVVASPGVGKARGATPETRMAGGPSPAPQTPPPANKISLPGRHTLPRAVDESWSDGSGRATVSLD